MEQGKKPGIAEAIDVVELFYDLMLSDMDKETDNMMAIMEYWPGKPIRNLQYKPRSHQTTIGMLKVLCAEPWNELQSPSPRSPTPTITNLLPPATARTERAISSSLQDNKAASSKGSFANVLAAWQSLCHMGRPNRANHTIPQPSSRQVVRFIQKLFDFLSLRQHVSHPCHIHRLRMTQEP